MNHIVFVPFACLALTVTAQAQEAPPPTAEPVEAAKAEAAPEKPVADDAYLEKLTEALKDEDSFKIRLQAAVYLGRTGDVRAVEPLLPVLSGDEHYTVRAAAAMALANLVEPRAISHIVRQAAIDPEEFVRGEAARALRKYDRDEALPYVVATYGSDDSRVRKEVVTYLAEGSLDVAEVVLVRAVGDVAEIHDVAQTAIKTMTPEEQLRFLGIAVEHRQASVRRGAIEVLRTIDTKAATDLILSVYERDIEVDQVRDAARAGLRALRHHLDVGEVAKVAVGNTDKHTRARSIKLLGVVGGPEAEKALSQTLKDPEIYLRGTAVMAFRDMGNPTVVPQLEKLLQDPTNQRIGLQIRNAIKVLQKPTPTN